MEALRLYGANVVSFQLESCGRWWFIVGCYLSPYDASAIEDVVAAIIQWTRGGALLMVSDFNTDLVAPEFRARDEEITKAMAESGIEDINIHFLPRHKPWLKDGCTWAMHRGRW